VAECPSLPDRISQGRTKKETVRSIREATDADTEAPVVDRLPVPEETFDAVLVAAKRARYRQGSANLALAIRQGSDR
jgi:predicted RNase H-like HicB family nuclease